MRAVSENEGMLEAVNSYDNAFMSFGPFQWTAGTGSAGGELADLLDRLKTSKPAAFNEYFGKIGLDLKIGPPKPGALRTGFLVLDGQALNTPTRKSVLRKPIWGYRFWRAGHDTDVRACEIEHAMARIDVFYRGARSVLGGKAVSDFITSELGVALLLDQHVNRPGHVPKTLGHRDQELRQEGSRILDQRGRAEGSRHVHHGTRQDLDDQFHQAGEFDQESGHGGRAFG